MASKSELDSELESFRRQWISDIQSLQEHHPQPEVQPDAHTQHDPLSPPSSASIFGPSKHPFPTPKPNGRDDHDIGHETPVFDNPETETSKAPVMEDDDPRMTALEAYERAAEREASGQMGESLRLYRKAFKLNDRVDLEYRKKHHGNAPHARAPDNVSAPSAPAPAPAPASMPDLIASFAHLSIVPATAPVEGDPEPPCPIASLPTEILLHIFSDVADDDVGDFVRLARVCRRFAFIVATEESIWRHVCEQSAVGFGGMHRQWQFSLGEPAVANIGALSSVDCGPLLPEYSSWRAMFRSRPRIRFNGCYITTVNYPRSGMAITAQVSWNDPIHIVTYYRYLRFFRDGSVISLLTTRPPASVVHQLTREALDEHGGGRYGQTAMSGALSHPAVGALRGRWRMGGTLPATTLEFAPADPETDPDETNVVVETDGINSKYTYRMELALRNAGRGTRNNKLVWRAFYSYNRLTDDWAEFGLKHDKPYIFSRVKSYGRGE